MRKDTKAYTNEKFKNKFGRKPTQIEKAFVRKYGKLPTTYELKQFKTKVYRPFKAWYR